MSEKRTNLAANCWGATQPGEKPPLQSDGGAPIVVTFNKDGAPYNVYCSLLQDDKCFAGGDRVTSETAPACLYPVGARRSEPMSATTPPAEALLSAPSILRELTSGGEVEVLSSHPVVPNDEESDEVFVVLGPDMHPLTAVDLASFSSETEKRERMHQEIRSRFSRREEALLMGGKPLGYWERRKRLADKGWYMFPAIHFIAPIRDKSGTRVVNMNKRLPNGTDRESFAFVYSFAKDGSLSQINIAFPASTMKINFEQRQITTVELVLGIGQKSNEAALPTLRAHGQAKSKLYEFISSTPAVMPEGRKLTGKTMIKISFKDLTVYLENNYINKETFAGGQYFQDLSFSAFVNRFIARDDLNGTGGLSPEDFVAISQNVLQLLPFAPMDLEIQKTNS